MAKERAKYGGELGKVTGKDVLLYINYGEGATEELPKWQLIGGQTTADLSMSADSIDASNKTSGGWGENYAGIKSTELSLECVLCKADEGYAALKDAFVKSEPVDICRFCAVDKTADRNWYNITELSDSTPHDDMVTVSITLEGIGAPSFYSNKESIDDITGVQA